MSENGSGIAQWSIEETPIAILDFETTGLTPGSDRVVEVSIVRKEPGQRPTLVYDSLVRPPRPMAATEIHGITAEDVMDAPTFSEISGDIVDCISGCVVSSYNIQFDIRFLEHELSSVGVETLPPHFCLMRLRPMLELGNRCSLEDACRHHNVDHVTAHISSTDVEAAAQLLDVYLVEMEKKKVRTFADLGALKHFKFVDSFSLDPFDQSAYPELRRGARPKSRRARIVAQTDARAQDDSFEEHRRANRALGTYWDELKSVLADYLVTDDEIAHLEQKKKELGLSPEQIRVLHARIFIAVMSTFVDDQWLDDNERQNLRRLYRCLSQLGWAPGQ